MRIVCLADTHLQHHFEVPEGDLLVIAGDLTGKGSLQELKIAMDWLQKLPHEHKCFIAGNHDFCFQTKSLEARALVPKGIHYLQDSGVNINGFNIWGSPWQPNFFDWAFNLKRGLDIKEKWDLIPLEADVVITHGPPYGVGDLTLGRFNPPSHVGCQDLLDRIQDVQPLLHVFGHIHPGYGRVVKTETIFVNASVCDENYEPINPPIVVDL